MATFAINEEIVSQMARAIGDAHMAVKRGVGDENTPGTALFAVSQLQTMALRQVPKFGIIETDPAGFEVTPDPDDPRFVLVNGGQVGFGGERIVFAPQRVSIVRSFAPVYSSSMQYGVRIGIPYSELERTINKIYSTTLSASASAGAQVVYITDPSLVKPLGFPLMGYINSTFVIFNGFNDAGTGLKIDPGYNNGSGLPSGSYGAGSRVNFLYEPRVLSLCGLPVAAGASNDPAEFGYFPPLPADWLSVADILVDNPLDPEVATFGADPAILRTAKEYPEATSEAPVFIEDDAKTMAKVIGQTRAALRQNRSRAGVGDWIRALENYTNKVADTPATSFRSFWGKRPFKPTTYFARGISFNGLERFEFTDSFAQAYYDTTGHDVQRTFAVFRGDLYQNASVITGNPPTSLTANSYRALSCPSLLTRGTYVYGVSAVTANGETPPVYSSVIADASVASTYVNELSWPQVSGAQFYHIYRRSSISGDVQEYRITSDDEVTGYGTFTQPDYTAAVFTAKALGNDYTAFKISAAGSTQFGGIQFYLRYTPSGSNSDLEVTPAATITVALYDDDSGKPGELIAEGTPIVYSDITTSYQAFVSQIDALLASTSATNYWIVLNVGATPAYGTFQLQVVASGSTNWATSSDAATWTVTGSGNVRYRLLGYLDSSRTGLAVTRRGVKLTGKIGLEARRLRVYVPPVEDAARGALPLYGESGSVFGAEETTETKNEMVVSVTAQNGENGLPVVLTATIPKGTVRDTSFPLGTTSQKFDRVLDVQVLPGSSLTTGANGAVKWSIYDLITVETMP